MIDLKHPQVSPGYDVIGDIHGFAAPLRRLLTKLGYQPVDGTYRHESGRQVAYLGDFIDRGPEIRETLHLVKSMVDAGSAVAVMGNHEFNAICFHTPDGNGDFLRTRIADGGKNVAQHQATLDAFAGREKEWEEWIAWFKQLPFALDLGGLRAVHATWDPKWISFLANRSLEDPAFLHASTQKGSLEFEAVETVLKGIEIPLPRDDVLPDKEGFKRHEIRVRWWEEPSGKTYRDVVFPNCDTVSDTPIDFDRVDAWEAYESTAPPVFFGHYWLPASLEPAPAGPNVACLDYSVAKPGGKLVAYRWDGESRLDGRKFVTVSA